jgi:L-aspartate semialdehyde sulfurtransferase ferredoxin
MATTRAKITFPPDLVNQPMLYTMSKQFGVVTNIRRANIGRDRGWMIVEIQGSQSDVDRSLAWAREQGLHVELEEPEKPEGKT